MDKKQPIISYSRLIKLNCSWINSRDLDLINPDFSPTPRMLILWKVYPTDKLGADFSPLRPPHTYLLWSNQILSFVYDYSKIFSNPWKASKSMIPSKNSPAFAFCLRGPNLDTDTQTLVLLQEHIFFYNWTAGTRILHSWSVAYFIN